MASLNGSKDEIKIINQNAGLGIVGNDNGDEQHM